MTAPKTRPRVAPPDVALHRLKADVEGNATIANATPYCARRSSRSAPTGSRRSREKRHTRMTEAEESRSAFRANPAKAGLSSRIETTSASDPTTPFHAIVKTATAQT